MDRARLRQIIKEELSRALREADEMDPMGMKEEDPDVPLTSARGTIASMRDAYPKGELDSFVHYKNQFDNYKQRIAAGKTKDTWTGNPLPTAIAGIPTFEDYLADLQEIYEEAGGNRIAFYELAAKRKLVERGSEGSRTTNWLHGFLEGGGDINQMIADAAMWEEATGTWSRGTEEVKPGGYDVEPGVVAHPATRSKYSGRQLDPMTGQPIGQAGEPMKFGRSSLHSLQRFGGKD